MSGSFLGPRFTDDEIGRFLDVDTATSRAGCDGARLADEVAGAAGRGESRRPVPGTDGVRPARARRPLDHRRRAVAEDAVGDEPEDQVPRVVPAVRAGRAARARRTTGSSSTRDSPYMLLVADVLPSRRLPVPESARTLWGIDKLNVPRSTMPAITHVDYSARIQTVRRDTNPLYYDIIDAFYRRTGCPVIVNTSFNVRGEPIVCTPEDAYRCFMRTDMDALVLENFVLLKTDQAPLRRTSRGGRSSCSIDVCRRRRASSSIAPSASRLAAYWELLMNLTKREVKGRYSQSFFGVGVGDRAAAGDDGGVHARVFAAGEDAVRRRAVSALRVSRRSCRGSSSRTRSTPAR